ncbi:MAG: tRNA (adenosine(37)-N6)-threonylcarbamoyltransferase complex dimerization subunit type 1 TsaB [Dehalococcoidia bacterium]
MILAIDTASATTGLALWADGLVAEVAWRSDRRQTAELLPRLDALLKQAGATLDQLSGLVVVVGPGSFNGIRVGLTTAQAFALARDLPLVGVTLFEAMAWPYLAIGPVGAVLPAGRDHALAIVAAEGTGIATVLAPTIVPAERTSELLVGSAVVVSGVAGVEAAEASLVSGVAATPRPAVVAEIGERRLRAGPSEPVEPLYLRAPQITPPRPRPPAGRPEGAR